VMHRQSKSTEGAATSTKVLFVEFEVQACAHLRRKTEPGTKSLTLAVSKKLAQTRSIQSPNHSTHHYAGHTRG